MSQAISTKSNVRRRAPFGLAPWIPRDLFDFERFFESMFDSEHGLSTEAFGTRVDMVETDQTIEIKMDLPGVAANDIEVHVENNLLTIRGERREEKEDTDKARQYHRVERRFGSFSRSMVLPCPVNDAEAVAEFKDGVLKVTLPKTESAKPRKIAIK